MSKLLEVSQSTVDGVRVVRAVGEVDVATAPMLHEGLEAVVTSAQRVVVDLTGVTFLDSTGLGVLIASNRQLAGRDGGGSMRLVVSHPLVLRVFEVTGLNSVFRICPTLEEALAQ